MSADERLSADQLGQITEAVVAALGVHPHECKFDPEDRRNMHEMCDILKNGGVEAFRDMISMSKQLTSSKRTIANLFLIAFAGGIVTAAAAVINAGLRSLFGIDLKEILFK